MLAKFLNNLANEISKSTLKLSSSDFEDSAWSEAVIHLNLRNEANAGISLFIKPRNHAIQLDNEHHDVSCSFWSFDINEQTIINHVRNFFSFTI